QRPEAKRVPEIPPLVLRIREDVGDMDGSTLHGGPSRPGASPRPEGELLQEILKLGRDPVIGPGAEDLAVEPPDDPLIGVAQSRRVLHEGLQDRAEVEGRSADQLEDFAGGRLWLARFGQVPLELAPGERRLLRPAGGRLGSALRLRTLGTATHRGLPGTRARSEGRGPRQSRRSLPRGQEEWPPYFLTVLLGRSRFATTRNA